MAKTVRMSDIAKRLNVSIVTVSKALAGKDGVSEELRNEIRRIAAEMGYQKKIVKNEVPAQGFTVGILTSRRYIEKGHSFYWTLYERCLHHLELHGHIGILVVISEQEEREQKLPRLIVDGRLDGMIVMGNFSDTYRDQLVASRVPLVAMDSFNAKYAQDSVISDGYYGMYNIVHYLLEMGHRDIMFVGSVNETSSIMDRYYGFCRAMREADIVVDARHVLPDRDEEGKIQISLHELEKLPTAFACNCDATAYTLLNLLKERKVRVPEDVSIVSFDNFILSELAVPQITTYAVDVEQMSKESVRQVIRRVQSPNAPIRRTVVSGSIVKRDSVAAVK